MNSASSKSCIAYCWSCWVRMVLIDLSGSSWVGLIEGMKRSESGDIDKNLGIILLRRNRRCSFWLPTVIWRPSNNFSSHRSLFICVLARPSLSLLFEVMFCLVMPLLFFSNMLEPSKDICNERCCSAKMQLHSKTKWAQALKSLLAFCCLKPRLLLFIFSPLQPWAWSASS